MSVCYRTAKLQGAELWNLFNLRSQQIEGWKVTYAHESVFGIK